MGKPTKKNIRRKNRRTRRKVNKKKMKKGGVSFGITRQFGKCHIDDETELKYEDAPHPTVLLTCNALFLYIPKLPKVLV